MITLSARLFSHWSIPLISFFTGLLLIFILTLDASMDGSSFSSFPLFLCRLCLRFISNSVLACYGSSLGRIQKSLKNTKWATLAKEWPTHSRPPKKYTQKIECSFFSLYKTCWRSTGSATCDQTKWKVRD
jgi:hypothetical protein